MIKITKTKEEATTEIISKAHTFNVNGKTVRVYTEYIPESDINGYTLENTIDKADLATLTDLEHEALGEDLQALTDLKEGESTEFSEEEDL